MIHYVIANKMLKMQNILFFKCPRYNEQRLVMFHKTCQIQPSSVSVVLNGNPDLTVEINSVLFDANQKYIKDTGCFNT